MKINTKVTIINRNAWDGFYYGMRGRVEQVFDDGSFEVYIEDKQTWSGELKCYVDISHSLVCRTKDIMVGL